MAAKATIATRAGRKPAEQGIQTYITDLLTDARREPGYDSIPFEKAAKPSKRFADFSCRTTLGVLIARWSLHPLKTVRPQLRQPGMLPQGGRNWKVFFFFFFVR